MPSEFDDLLAALRQVQDMRQGPEPIFAKAAPAAKPLPPQPPEPAPLNVEAMLRRIQANGREIMAGDPAIQARRKREVFFKSLTATRAALGRRIAEGSIGADEAIRAEIGLNDLEARARRLAAEAGR